MPALTTVYQWFAAHPEFAQHYARARLDQADTLADEILDISDDARNDWMERHGEEDAGWQVNGEHIQRSKLRVDARKWVASKLKPGTYGDKTETTHKGDKGAPIVISSTDDKL